MRDDVMMKLVTHALEDGGFRREALSDPEASLRKRGYELQPDELEAVRNFHAEMADKTSEEVAEHLNRRAQEEGI